MVIAFLAVNWRPVYLIVFSSEDPYSKFDFFDANTNFWTLYIIPLVFGLIATLISPYIANWASWWSAKPVNLRRIREVDAAHEVLKVKNKFAAERENQRAIIEQGLIDQAKRDQEILEIEDDNIKASLEASVSDVRDNTGHPREKELESILMHLQNEKIALESKMDTMREEDERARNSKQFDIEKHGNVYGLISSKHELDQPLISDVPRNRIFNLELGEGVKDRVFNVLRTGDTILMGSRVMLLSSDLKSLRAEGITVVQLPNR